MFSLFLSLFPYPLFLWNYTKSKPEHIPRVVVRLDLLQTLEFLSRVGIPDTLFNPVSLQKVHVHLAGPLQRKLDSELKDNLCTSDTQKICGPKLRVHGSEG